jgi:hypothetical protein
MGNSTPLFVGLDVHKDSIAWAHAQSGRPDPPVFVGAIGVRQADIDRLVRRLEGKTATVVFAYEARPCGYGLHRYLTGKGHTRQVVTVAHPQEAGPQGEDRSPTLSNWHGCSGPRRTSTRFSTSTASSRSCGTTISPAPVGRFGAGSAGRRRPGSSRSVPLSV